MQQNIIPTGQQVPLTTTTSGQALRQNVSNLPGEAYGAMKDVVTGRTHQQTMVGNQPGLVSSTGVPISGTGATGTMLPGQATYASGVQQSYGATGVPMATGMGGYQHE